MSKRLIPHPDEIGDDTPLRLDVAARLAFPDRSIGPSSLRREAAKGRLTVWRVAGKDMTTLGEIRKMVDRCLVNPSQPACGSDQPLKTEKPSGSSSIKENSTALAAARMRVRRLKQSSPSISHPSTTPLTSVHATHRKSR